MTEADWLACTDPMPMLDFLLGRATDRKMQLFAAAACRRIWHLLTDERSQRAVEIAERFADGLATDNDLQRAFDESADVAYDADAANGARAGANAAAATVDPDAGYAARAAASAAVVAVCANRTAIVGTRSSNSQNIWDDLGAVEAAAQAVILRDIVGNPSRQMQVATAWLAWNETCVVRIAQAIYDERAFDRLPILADALEDAGCDNADILNHCRSGGKHVRGCWVVDLLLGKE